MSIWKQKQAEVTTLYKEHLEMSGNTIHIMTLTGVGLMTIPSSRLYLVLVP
jgi:hypothetical protein